MLTQTFTPNRIIAPVEPEGTDAHDNTPARRTPEGVQPFPLIPSAFWDKPRQIEWTQVSPRSPFGVAAIALDLKHKFLQNGTLSVKTNLEELVMLLLYAWGHGGAL